MYNFRGTPRFHSIRNQSILSSALEVFKRFRGSLLFLMFLLPIYPSLSVLGSPDLETQVGDYDESTIITAYEGDIEDENNLLLSDAGMIRSIDEESKKEVKVSQNKLL